MNADINTLERMGFTRWPGSTIPHGSMWMSPDAQLLTQPEALAQADELMRDPGKLERLAQRIRELTA
jgi:hypothetical protein